MRAPLVLVSQKRKPADLFIIGHFEKDSLSADAARLEPELAKIAKTALGDGRFEGKFGQTLSFYHPDYREAPEILLFGLGERKNYKIACFRKAVGKITQWAKGRKAASARLLLESFLHGPVKTEEAAGVAWETSRLASYAFDKYLHEKNGGREKEVSLELLISRKQGLSGLRKKAAEAAVVAEGVLFARDLINEPGNVMNAQRLAEKARQMARQKGLACRILGASELKGLRMGGILAVNQGSKTPPALILLEYGRRYRGKGTICLVGKGVTFDTGGISIKPSKDMEKMKYDMSGAATVIAALGAVADLKLPRHVVGLAPAVENMVAENPQRPGDIIEMHNGKSVEVLNTDAEGRLILADALAYTKRYQPKAVIDVATLTGMAAMTFGDKCCAVMGNQEKLISRIRDAGEAVGERCWPLPLYDEYREQIKGHHSDLYNIGGPYGGSITAAMFLKEFVPEKTDWAHLDIAGTAWCDHAREDCPKGATGFGVRLLIQFLKDWK